ncbi:hypothetical protein [Blastopirellula retiformator]|uniref:Uncharacterized protein n=1 Tax=Blastopirellula retiformator TaxID=2527970 RepID=A0A5C5UUZ2_9BACT|nr:hypothetical protein [Blastopirellula retiformator]TWT29958.1 hypothetical protein Enr8_46150 [Blastopirellula retiformator]
MIHRGCCKFFNEMIGVPLVAFCYCYLEDNRGGRLALDSLFLDSEKLEGSLTLKENGRLFCRLEGVGCDGRDVASCLGEEFRLVLVVFDDFVHVKIPLFNGSICEDVNKWEYSDGALVAQVLRQSRQGYVVRVGNTKAILPGQYLTKELRQDLGGLIHKVFEFELVATHENGDIIVKPIGPFLSFQDWWDLPDSARRRGVQ